MRVGILVDNEKVPAWVAGIISEVNDFGNVQWVIAIQIVSNSKPEHTSFKLFRKLDSILLPGKPNLSERIDLNLPIQIPRVQIKLVRNEVETDALCEIENTKPDLLLYFGSKVINGELLDLPKFGVWRLLYGNANQTCSGPPGFWEWFHQLPVTGISILQLKNKNHGDECLNNSTTRTECLSFSRNQTAIFAKGINLMVNMVSKLADSGKLPDPWRTPLPHDDRTFREPNFWNFLNAIWKLGYRAISKFITKTIFLEQWVLFFSFRSQSFPKLDFQKFKELIPPKDRIWADPFIVSKDGLHYVFIEELIKKTNRGHISCMVLNQSGEIEAARRIIERPYHLSYPFIFQHKDTWYIIPESGENKTVDLFECTNFPFDWKFKKSLLTNIEAYDSTLHFHEGQFWLFCTIKKRLGASTDDDLYLFYSQDLLDGDWQQHPNNPVVSDPSSARPAGRIFYHNNSLFRPSQICVPRYGYGLSLNKIVELSESSYQEENVSHALPNWRKDLLSLHTLNFTDEITLIDGQLKRSKF